MANKRHLRIIEKGVEVWNKWREKELGVNPDLSEADLSGMNLSQADLIEANLSEAMLNEVELGGADLSGATLTKADLSMANLCGADLSMANLSEADLSEAKLSEAELGGADLSGANLTKGDLSRANLSGADLTRADLGEADLSDANLSEAQLKEANLKGANLNRANLEGAALRKANLKWATLIGANLSLGDLTEADLSGAALKEAHLNGANLTRADLSGAYLEGTNLMNASLVETSFEEAVLMDCKVYGIFTWALKLNQAKQSNLIITPHGEPAIGVDNLEVAHFIYLLLYSEKVRDVIEALGKKVVLILGRFSDKRRPVLNAIREELSRRDYLPIFLAFDPLVSLDYKGKISALARLSRFIIADLSDPRGIPEEFTEIVAKLPSVPVRPLLQVDAQEYEMVERWKDCPWVLEIHRYTDLDDLLPSLGDKVIEPAAQKAQELQKR
jgi:uncharacterized protein YjbI with pentapeptide repeats